MGLRGSKTEQEMLVKYESETFLDSSEIANAYKIFSACFPEGNVPSIEFSRVPMQDLMEKLPFLKFNPFRDRICAVYSTYPVDYPTPDPTVTSPMTETDATSSFSRDPNGPSTGPQMHTSPSGRQLASAGGSWRFDDFIHFLSAFNEKAPVGLKHEVAFCIYDSDGDGYIGEQDLMNVVQRLVGHFSLDSSIQVNQSHEVGANPYDVQRTEFLTEPEYTQIVDQVFHEADLDRDRKMALKEFTNTMNKFPDFARHFCVPSLQNYVQKAI